MSRVAVVARRPQIDGPVTLDRFVCPASRLAGRHAAVRRQGQLQRELHQRRRQRAHGDQHHDRRRQRLAAFAGDLTYKGPLTDVRGRVKLAAQSSRMGTIYADRTRLNGGYALGIRAGTFDHGRRFCRRQRGARPLDARRRDPAARRRRQDADRSGRDERSAKRSAAPRATSTLPGKIRVVNFPGGGAARITNADIIGPGGARARVSAAAESPITGPRAACASTAISRWPAAASQRAGDAAPATGRRADERRRRYRALHASTARGSR